HVRMAEEARERGQDEYTYHDAAQQQGGALSLEEIKVSIPHELSNSFHPNAVSIGDNAFMVPASDCTGRLWLFSYTVSSDGDGSGPGTDVDKVYDRRTGEHCLFNLPEVDLAVQGGKVYGYHDSEYYLSRWYPDIDLHMVVHIVDLARPGPFEKVFCQNSCVTRSIGLDGVIVDTPNYEYAPLGRGHCCPIGDGMILLSGESGEYILDTETMELIRDMREAPRFTTHCAVDGVLHTFGRNHYTYTLKVGWIEADPLPEFVHPVRQAE
ncbi:hypothetical protein KIPB_014186, partial [Kipferlia bialata]